jgi:uncharacterized protein YhaN
MIIKDVQIDGFGVWHGLQLLDLSPRCTVFYGRNEAGKSTLLEFLRGVLFGFTTERTLRYFPPVHGGLPGGHLELVPSESRTGRLLRRLDSRTGSETISLTVENELLPTESALADLLCDVDENTFNNVFAVGLHELQELGTLDDIHASRWLYSLTAGLDRVSLSDVTRELEHSRNRLISSEPGSQVAFLLNERDRLRREIEDLADLPRQFEQLLAHRDGIDREKGSIQESAAKLAGEVPAIDCAIVVHDVWHHRRALTAQVEAMEAGNTWPANALQKMDQLRSLHAKAQRALRDLKAERGKLTAELAKLPFDDRLWRQSAQITALAEHESWIISVEQEFDAAEQSAKKLGEQYSAHENQVKSGSAAVVASPEAIQPNAWAILRGPAARLSKARRRLKKARAESEKHQSGTLSRKQELEKALSGRGQRDLTAAFESTGSRVQQMRRRIQIEKQVEQNAHVIAGLEQHVAGLLEQQILPPNALFTIGVIFVVGSVLFLSGLLLPASFTGSWGWPMVFFGALGGVSAMAAKLTMEHAVTTELSSAQKQLAMARSQANAANKEFEELDDALPKGNGPLSLRLQSAEQELAKLEQLLPLEAQRQSADAQTQEHETKLANAEAIYKNSRHRWKAALASVGLPLDTTPLQAQEITIAGGRLSAANVRLADANSDVERRRKELNALAARIQQVFLSAGLRPESNRASAQLRQLTGALANHEKIQQQRQTLSRQRRRLKRKRVSIADRLEQLNRRRGYLLKKCEVVDVADFNRRASESTKLKSLKAELETVNREVESILGDFPDVETVETHVEKRTIPQLQEMLTKIRDQLAALEFSRNGLTTQREQLRKQVDRTSADKRTALKRFQLGLIEERLSAALRRWQTLTVTQRVLEQIKLDYEKNRQPEALRDASVYLAQFTSHRYVRVWTTFGADTLLVEDSHGRSLHVEQLSRGTREQLFLSLRMAIVGMFARRGARLPMILDDVLVNFDNDRAAAAVDVLQAFASKGHQLIIFTCHEHVARLFKLGGADVRRLPESGRPGRDLPFEIEEPMVQLPIIELPVVEEPAVEEPPVVPTVSVTTAQPEFITVPAVFEITAQVVNTPAQVDVHVIESPVLPPLPAPSPQPRRRVRVDVPQRRRQAVPTIRRRWAAEEFSGELDDRINPQWLQHELSANIPPPLINKPLHSNGSEDFPLLAKAHGGRLLKLFDAESMPVVIEVAEELAEDDFG